MTVIIDMVELTQRINRAIEGMDAGNLAEIALEAARESRRYFEELVEGAERDNYAVNRWSVDDLQSALGRGGYEPVSEEQGRDMMADIEGMLSDATTEAGWAVIEDKISDWEWSGRIKKRAEVEEAAS